jgi:hypothetical protein
VEEARRALRKEMWSTRTNEGQDSGDTGLQAVLGGGNPCMKTLHQKSLSTGGGTKEGRSAAEDRHCGSCL